MSELNNRQTTGAAAGSSSPDMPCEVSTFRHDARNQLNLILGYVDLLDRPNAGLLTDKQRSYVERIRSAATTLDEMVSHLLRQPNSPAGGSA